MNLSNEEYSRIAKKYETKSNLALDMLKAFLVGGLICLIGQALTDFYMAVGFDKEQAASFCSMTLVLISATMTATGLYTRAASVGGAGTLVPITGFANGIAASAIEFRAEGWVLGVGAKIFSIAGPVILYGSAASVVCGIVHYCVISLT